jgi:hypothetical protein
MHFPPKETFQLVNLEEASYSSFSKFKNPKQELGFVNKT